MSTYPSSDGHICPRCGTWVLYSSGHACGNVPPNEWVVPVVRARVPPPPRKPSIRWDRMSDVRVAVALERIAAALERLAEVSDGR